MIRIKQLILWSNGDEKKIVDFNLNGITVLIGDGKAGKTSIIRIIDYCLGSSECDIPGGLIRQSCSWFGITIVLDETTVLIARKSPQNTNVSNEMYFEVLQDDVIPDVIEVNKSRLEIKNYFNEHFKLSNLSLDTNVYTKDYIPSYRDTIGLNFYTQQLLLDDAQYFYKQNIEPHGKNFKMMFPYMMGMSSMEDIVNQQRLDAINRHISLLERQKNKNIRLVNEWEIESEEKILHSIKLGIVDDIEIPITFNEKLAILKKAKNAIITDKINITKSSLYVLNKEITTLENRRSNLYQDVFSINTKLKAILKQMNQIKDFQNDNKEAVESRKISDWLLNDIYLINNISQSDDSYAKKIYNQIIETIKKEEENILFYENMRVSLDKEYLELNELSKVKLEELKILENTIEVYKNNNVEYSDEFSLLQDLYSFYGELDNYIKIYEMMADTSNIDNQLTELRKEKKIYEAKLISDEDNDEDSLELFMNGTLETFLDTLNIEYKKPSEVWFNSKNIEFRFGLTKTGVPMSKIGSGSNHIQYHIAMAMLLQIYIQNKVKNKCTFDFLIFDQPSEAYFPTEMDNEKYLQEHKTEQEKQNDIESLHDLFSTIANTQKNHCRDLQIIVLEHADDSYWKDIHGDYYTDKIKIINWKDINEKLIPLDWITEELNN
jgi:Protein of unknown function (DUF3732).